MSTPFAGQFGIYLHYPYCTNRCGYCEFATVSDADFPHQAYADWVLEELERRAVDFQRFALRALYLGGGTPSLWPAEQIARVVTGCLGRFSLAAEVEVTIEANPNTITSVDTLRALRESGINRLSIGTQSFDDRTLIQLTRVHDAATNRQAIEAAAAAGIDNVSCDLIVGSNGQTVEHYLAQIEALLAHRPRHVSTYGLTLSRGSALYRAGQRPAEHDLMAELLDVGAQRLTAAGYQHYEVSNFALPGFRSQHNALVWAYRPYLGLGASAHSMVVDVTGERYRQINPPFSVYRQGKDNARREVLTHQTASYEAMMLGLRTSDGVSRTAFFEAFGCDPTERFAPKLEPLVAAELLQIDERAIRPTARGLWFADEVAVRLLG
ncbi:MAG: radical SAM family heme chaperone HemW [Deltaproteobacteria bacterium]|nr:radical SAM family heme chaperone HemW [Deltaproteobacteria bacterium]